MRLKDIHSNKRSSIVCAYIPIAGRLGSGKTTLATHLANYLKDFSDFTPIIFSFADMLREEVADVLEISPKKLKQQDVKKMTLGEFCGPEFTAKLPKDFPKVVSDDTTVRQLLQWWGTEYRRAQDPNYWVKRTAEYILSIRLDIINNSDELYPKVAFICDDVRFPNELELFRAMEREQKHAHCYPVYLRHYGFARDIDMMSQIQFLKPKSFDGGHPEDNEHPSEYLLDLPRECWDSVWKNGWVMSPTYGRLDTHAMMVFDRIILDLEVAHEI